MSDHTVYDFLSNPDLLAEEEPLTEEQLALVGDVAMTVDLMMPLSELIEVVRVATGHDWIGSS